MSTSSNPPSLFASHLLSSLMPHQTFKIPPPPQIPKSKQFYKPQECIWNNPHRTSKKMYKFYHQQNQQYQKGKMKQIQKLEEKDREEQERKWVQRMRRFRDQTREEFYGHKRNREILEAKTCQDLGNGAISMGASRAYSTLHHTQIGTQAARTPLNVSSTSAAKILTQPYVPKTFSSPIKQLPVHSHYKPSSLTELEEEEPQPQVNSRDNLKKSSGGQNYPTLNKYSSKNKIGEEGHKTKQQQQSQRLIRIQNAYKQSIKKYDMHTEELQRMIKDQNQAYHRKIRQEFRERKNVNDQTNSRFYSHNKKYTIE